MGWNPFLEFAKSVKNDYVKRFHECFYETGASDRKRNATCLNLWAEKLGNKKYLAILSGLNLQQYKTFIIAHYNPYSSAEDEDGNAVNYKDFFYLYDSLYKECRGVMIDIEKEKLVLVPFRKFFNLNEMEECTTEKVSKRIETAKCVEFSNKLDGSMIPAGIYPIGGKPEVVASASNCNSPESSYQLKNALDYLSKHPDYTRMLYDHPDDTYIFEHIFPQIDPHIVRYEQNGLYLVGIRNKETGKEEPYSEVIRRAEEYGVLTTEVYQITLDNVLENLDAKAAAEAEGFVANIDGYRVKIKYNDYVAMHRMAFQFGSYNGVIKAIADNSLDDALSKIPECYREDVLKRAGEVTDIVDKLSKIVEEYASHLPKGDRKTAMIWVNENVPKAYQGFVRNIYYGRDIEFLKKGNTYRSMADLLELLATKTQEKAE